MTTESVIRDKLLSAVRQYRHNSNNDFVFGYDIEEAIRIVKELFNSAKLAGNDNSVHPTTIPVGCYFGLITVGRADFWAGGNKYEAYFNEGLRGSNISTNVTVNTDGDVKCRHFNTTAYKVLKIT